MHHTYCVTKESQEEIVDMPSLAVSLDRIVVVVAAAELVLEDVRVVPTKNLIKQSNKNGVPVVQQEDAEAPFVLQVQANIQLGEELLRKMVTVNQKLNLASYSDS